MSTPSVSSIKSFRLILDGYTPELIESEYTDLTDTLLVGTDPGDGTFSRPLALTALNTAPQNFIRAVKLAEAVRRVHAEEEIRARDERAGLMTAARKKLREEKRAKPSETEVKECARARFVGWADGERVLVETSAAVALADGLVRAWRDREASLRRMLDER